MPIWIALFLFLACHPVQADSANAGESVMEIINRIGSKPVSARYRLALDELRKHPKDLALRTELLDSNVLEAVDEIDLFYLLLKERKSPLNSTRKESNFGLALVNTASQLEHRKYTPIADKLLKISFSKVDLRSEKIIVALAENSMRVLETQRLQHLLNLVGKIKKLYKGKYSKRRYVEGISDVVFKNSLLEREEDIIIFLGSILSATPKATEYHIELGSLICQLEKANSQWKVFSKIFTQLKKDKYVRKQFKYADASSFGRFVDQLSCLKNPKHLDQAILILKKEGVKSLRLKALELGRTINRSREVTLAMDHFFKENRRVKKNDLYKELLSLVDLMDSDLRVDLFRYVIYKSKRNEKMLENVFHFLARLHQDDQLAVFDHLLSLYNEGEIEKLGGYALTRASHFPTDAIEKYSVMMPITGADDPKVLAARTSSIMNRFKEMSLDRKKPSDLSRVEKNVSEIKKLLNENKNQPSVGKIVLKEIYSIESDKRLDLVLTVLNTYPNNFEIQLQALNTKVPKQSYEKILLYVLDNYKGNRKIADEIHYSLYSLEKDRVAPTLRNIMERHSSDLKLLVVVAKNIKKFPTITEREAVYEQLLKYYELNKTRDMGWITYLYEGKFNIDYLRIYSRFFATQERPITTISSYELHPYDKRRYFGKNPYFPDVSSKRFIRLSDILTKREGDLLDILYYLVRDQHIEKLISKEKRVPMAKRVAKECKNLSEFRARYLEFVARGSLSNEEKRKLVSLLPFGSEERRLVLASLK